MSTEKGGGEKSSSRRDEAAQKPHRPAYQEEQQHEKEPKGPPSDTHATSEGAGTAANPAHHAEQQAEEGDRKPAAVQSPPAPGSTIQEETTRPRQVIAVSASKGPAAFFNLARKFLVTDETCDLSALEGAIVSAVDAAHLLERSQLATVVRIQTSYVTVEPKRRRQQAAQAAGAEEQQPGARRASTESAQHPTQVPQSPGASQFPPRPSTRGSSGGRELRRARIVITVRRTENYKQWLEENPLQAIIAGDGDEGEEDAGETEAGKPS